MKYSYGTAGFRYPVKTIIEICESDDFAIAILTVMTLINLQKGDKTLGIMITASHNPSTDNGVKIINHNGGMLSNKYEKIITNIVNNNYDKKLLFDKENSKNYDIIIGYDTRYSGKNILYPIIENNLKRNIGKSKINIINAGICTTPEFHVKVFNRNVELITNDYTHFYGNQYLLKYSNLILDNSYILYTRSLIEKYKIDFSNVVIDCANGVGYCTLSRIFEYYDYNISPLFLNTYVEDDTFLNKNCGSDYIQNCIINNEKININCINDDKLYVSLDGDADRILFYVKNGNNIKMMDGDFMIALIIKSIYNDILSNINSYNHVTIGVIYTPYTNSGLLDFIDRNCVNVHNKCSIIKTKVPTGVKNLMAQTDKTDISICFEPNGHGTVIVNNHHNIPNIIIISQLFNKFVGDGIMNLFGIMYILKYMNFSYDFFSSLYTPRETILKKINVQDKNKYVTNECGDILLEPINVAKNINNTINEYFKGCRCFVRPSGTENILRLYIENNNNNSKNIKILEEMIVSIINKN